MALSDDKLWDLWNAQGTDDMSRIEAFTFARAIEAEVRKGDTELIRQLVEALRIDRIETEDWPADSRIAIDALRARLERPCA